MERNLAALLDSRAYTIRVRYQPSFDHKNYTYVSNLPELFVGDFVVVPTRTRDVRSGRNVLEELPDTIAGFLREIPERVRLSVAIVTEVHDSIQIPPNADITYAWVISKVRLTDYGVLLHRNKQITDAVAEAHKTSVRKTFAERIMGELPEGAQASLRSLLGVDTRN